MENSIRLLFHLVATANFAYGIYYDLWELKLPHDFAKISIDYAGQLKYLTFWNMVLQLIYFSFSIFNDLFGSNSISLKERAALQSVRDFLFGSLVFPLGMFVATTFWILWAFDRELVFPVALDAFFPGWLNHVMHTTVVPLDFIELFFIPKTFPERSHALAGLSILMLGYLAWVFFIAFKTDFWVYPVLAVLHWGYRLLFIAGLMVLASLMYICGEKLHYYVWGQQTLGAVRPRQNDSSSRLKTPSKIPVPVNNAKKGSKQI
ncbi:androgen-induced gene 1 protein-like [Daphnia carinata]|uniref:androgen-induced gene 1 protein-like n=1 Tax=Daphnia carinata TaxID=120202 RepID=UPI00257EE17A|nr:androgen-induced gene 1 protein-like [Daphnia carinata]